MKTMTALVAAAAAMIFAAPANADDTPAPEPPPTPAPTAPGCNSPLALGGVGGLGGAIRKWCEAPNVFGPVPGVPWPGMPPAEQPTPDPPPTPPQ